MYTSKVYKLVFENFDHFSQGKINTLTYLMLDSNFWKMYSRIKIMFDTNISL